MTKVLREKNCLLERDQNQVLLLGNILTGINRIVTVSCSEPAAVNPNQNGLFCIARLRLSPDINSQAVLAELVASLSIIQQKVNTSSGEVDVGNI